MFISNCMNQLELPSVDNVMIDTNNRTGLRNATGSIEHPSLHGWEVSGIVWVFRNPTFLL